MKQNRNDKCWCGSGIKFKKCHYGREEQEPISKREAINESKKIGARKRCCVPKELQHECSKRIIKAHTVSKSGSLNAIADSTNHVLGLKIDLPNLIKNKGKLAPEKIGVKQASTFEGFCSYHDKHLFSCIEDEVFIGNEEQCFSLVYRAVTKEIYAKEGSVKTSEFLKDADKGKPLIDQMFIQQFIGDHSLGLNAAEKELSDFKKLLDSKLLKNSTTELCHLIISSKTPPPVMVSSIVAPTVDFVGNQIQDLGDLSVVPDYVVFNSFASQGNGHIVFSWLKSAIISHCFIDTLLSLGNVNIFNALVRFFFSMAENTFISPDWWNKLPDKNKRKINELIMSGASPFHPDSPDKLVDDGINYGTWDIEKILKVNF